MCVESLLKVVFTPSNGRSLYTILTCCFQHSPLNRNEQQIDFGEVTPMVLLLENDCSKLEIE